MARHLDLSNIFGISSIRIDQTGTEEISDYIICIQKSQFKKILSNFSEPCDYYKVPPISSLQPHHFLINHEQKIP